MPGYKRQFELLQKGTEKRFRVIPVDDVKYFCYGNQNGKEVLVMEMVSGKIAVFDAGKVDLALV